jgi:hypothetical protein
VAEGVKKQDRGTDGGAANEAGAEFRGAFGAWVAAHALAGKPLPAIGLDTVHSVPTGKAQFESNAAVDDAFFELGAGASLFAQAKRSLTLGTAEEGAFAKTVRQIFRQTESSDFDPAVTRLAIVVENTTGPLRALQRALERRRASSAAPPTKDEEDALETFSRHLTGARVDHRERALQATAVLVLDFTSPECPSKVAAIAMLEASVVPPGMGLAAWNALQLRASHAAARRLGLTLADWCECLRAAGIVLRADADGGPSARAEATALAVSAYRARLVVQGGRLSLRTLHETVPNLTVQPDTRAIDAKRSDRPIARPLSWVARRCGRLLLRGLPGIGKSAALRRLAAEVAAEKGMLPLIVRLPRTLENPSGNALETLVDAAVASLPEDERTLVRNEALHCLRRSGRALLLLDGLDECRSRRNEVTELIKEALDELHADAEVVLATRDSAYASASVLGFDEATLQTPHDLLDVVRQLSGALARELSPGAEEASMIERLMASVPSDLHQSDVTPLEVVGLVVAAAVGGPSKVGRGGAGGRTALVEWIARRWELSVRWRHDFTVSGQLKPNDSTRFILDAFDFISELLSTEDSIAREELSTRLSLWAEQNWSLTTGPARAAAEAAINFWDEAGVFVAEGRGAIVRARQKSLIEVGHARWLASRDEKTRSNWISASGALSDYSEVVKHLVALLPAAGIQLLKEAVGQQHEIAVIQTVATALVSGGRTIGDDKSRLELGHMLWDRLLGLVRTMAPNWWVALECMLEFPPPNDIESLQATFSDVLPEHWSSLAISVSELAWGSGEPDWGRAMECLRLGPPKTPGGEKDPFALRSGQVIFARLAVEMARRTGPEHHERAQLLCREQRITAGHGTELRLALLKNGCEAILNSQESARFTETRTVARMEETAQASKVALFKGVKSLGRPTALSHLQERRLSELADLLETAAPCELPAATIHTISVKYQPLVDAVFAIVAELGAFDVGVATAQLEYLQSATLEENVRCDGVERALSNWPNGADGTALLHRVVKLFDVGYWGGDVACRALLHCPEPATATQLLRSVVESTTNYRCRAQAAHILLTIDPNAVDTATEWVNGDEVVCVRAGALHLARLYQEGRAALAKLEPLLDLDEAARESAIKQLRSLAVHDEPLRLFLERLGSIPPSQWKCRWCGEANQAGGKHCQACRTGPR